MNPRYLRFVLTAIAVVPFTSAANAEDIGTAFTFQGRLDKGIPPAPVNATCDFRFGLWDAPTGGNQIGTSPQTATGVSVNGSVFRTSIDFGASAINGTARWLAIEVKCPGNRDFVLRVPRVELTPVPYALRASQGMGPPGVVELTPTGQLILDNQLLFDPDNWTIAAITDEGTAPLTLESRNAGGDKTKLRIDDADSSFTFAGEVVLPPDQPLNTAGITPPPKLVLRLMTAEANAAGEFPGAGDGVSIAAFDFYGKTAVPLRLRGNVGIGLDEPSERLDVAGNIHASGTITSGGLAVTKSGDTVAVFNRTTNDGTIVSLRQGFIEEGTIAVSGTTVSYNAFTGSHYGWTDRVLSRGTLVVMTGENRRRYDDPGAEPIYGVAPSVAANDPKCLGAYLGLLEPAKAASMENPHQVMAVGNGDMWVVDTGKGIAPGDYLISSDAPGHAMLDDEIRFPVGYVVARAGEGVDWAKVSEAVDGRRHKRVSVFFESFERGSAVGLGKIVEQQQSRIEDLAKRLSELETAKGGAQ